MDSAEALKVCRVIILIILIDCGHSTATAQFSVILVIVNQVERFKEIEPAQRVSR